jgi:hypothetical protein
MVTNAYIPSYLGTGGRKISLRSLPFETNSGKKLVRPHLISKSGIPAMGGAQVG